MVEKQDRDLFVHKIDGILSVYSLRKELKQAVFLLTLLSLSIFLCSCSGTYRLVKAKDDIIYLKKRGVMIDSTILIGGGSRLLYVIDNDTIYRLDTNTLAGAFNLFIVRTVPGEPLIGSGSENLIGFSTTWQKNSRLS